MQKNFHLFVKFGRVNYQLYDIDIEQYSKNKIGS